MRVARTIFSGCCCAAAVFLAGGCSAVYFHETEKVSLTLEAKADATEPVAGNFGFKQRVVLVLPGTKDGETNSDAGDKGRKAAEEKQTQAAAREAAAAGGVPQPQCGNNPNVADAIDQAITNAATRANGEAVSVISYFDLDKQKGSSPLKPLLTIRSSFITGAAANALRGAQAAKAMNAVADVGSPVVGDIMTSLGVAYLAYLQPHWANDQTVQQKIMPGLDAMARFVPQAWDYDGYVWVGPNTLQPRAHQPLAAPANFSNVTAYYEDLTITIGALQSASDALQKGTAVAVKPAGGAGGPPAFSIDRRLDELKAKRAALEKNLRADPAGRVAIEYLAKNLTS